MANGDGVAGIAAIIGYLVMNVTMSAVLLQTVQFQAMQLKEHSSLLKPSGIHDNARDTDIGNGSIRGIIVGVLAAAMYNRFYTIELPQYLGFFAGKRFVPIITSICALLLGLVMLFIWPPIQGALNSFQRTCLQPMKRSQLSSSE
ncbi:PTS transporter subunit EIIC [Bacillus licheniformis]|nr:PTS transporter subunit EIIC [Bacillus licheniformis]